VVIAWVAIAVVTTALAGAVGRHYATNFSLPGTEAQRAQDLLTRESPTQSGDLDTIVFHIRQGTIESSPVRTTMEQLFSRVARMPHVVGVVSPYEPRGTAQVSRDGRTAFATVSYDKRANLLPDATGKPVLSAINAIKVPGLQVAAGGQVMEQA
jgi:RND superfamily putative drug exporter